KLATPCNLVMSCRQASATTATSETNQRYLLLRRGKNATQESMPTRSRLLRPKGMSMSPLIRKPTKDIRVTKRIWIAFQERRPKSRQPGSGITTREDFRLE